MEATAETAMGGVWKKGPGLELFDALKAKLGKIPIIAEDLGVITSDVVQLRHVLLSYFAACYMYWMYFSMMVR